MYLGYKDFNSDYSKPCYVICLEGTHTDVHRVKATSNYFKDSRFILATPHQLQNKYFCLKYFGCESVMVINKKGEILTNGTR